MIEKKKNSNLGITKAPKGVAGMAKLMSQGMAPVAAKNLLKKIRENKPSGRISQFDIKEALDKYKIKMPKRAPMQKGPMQARPLPMTPELIKKAKDRMVPNPRAQQSERDRSKPIIGKPMRRSSARKK